jgi:S-(hydroxymethyl)glutathione dehydrogenase / alcohol dehydrogenase
MKAAVLNEIPGQLEIEDVQVDGPGHNEVLIRTVAAGVCHSDLHFMEGTYTHPTPTVLGHESAGVVEEVGVGVTYVQPGDHVITCLSVFCGSCDYCLSGRPALCERRGVAREPGAEPRLKRNGTAVNQFLNLSSFAEKMLVHEHALVKIRPEMPLDRAALIGCGVTTGLGAVLNTARIDPGSTMAVIGCGGVGLAAIQGGHIGGAGMVIAVDTVASKLDLAKQLGATHTVNPSDGDPVKQVKELTEGKGVHYSFEAIGLKQTAEQAFSMLRRGGTATLIGLVPIGQRIEIHAVELLDEKKLQGSNMGSNRFRIDMPRYVDMYLNGRLKLDEMVSARRKLENVNDCFAKMKAGEVARSVLMFE